MKTLWFRRKKYGWGWTPITVEGWLSVVLYSIGVIVIVRYTTFVTLIFWTAALIAVCLLKGEKPRWQWGNSDDPTI